jgi:hypothetical protein
MIRVFLWADSEGDDIRRQASGTPEQVQFTRWGVLLLNEPTGQPKVLYPWHRVRRIEMDEEVVDAAIKSQGRKDLEEFRN